MTTRGFTGRRPAAATAQRLPPGQSWTDDFPVLSFGPTPTVDLARWNFALKDGARTLARWSWSEFNALPQTAWRGDIHCVTKWSKLDTAWEGVTVDDLLAAVGVAPPTAWVLAQSHDGYDTNVPFADLAGGKAMVATRFAGAALAVEHGGPARLLVPHLYFWKSAKWVDALRFTPRNEPGFWELRGYHDRGDPWREQRYTNDP